MNWPVFFPFFLLATFVSLYTFFRVTATSQHGGLAYRVLILPKDNVLRGNHYSVNIIQMTWTQSAKFMLLFYLLGLIAPEFKDWHWYDFDVISELMYWCTKCLNLFKFLMSFSHKIINFLRLNLHFKYMVTKSIPRQSARIKIY